MKTKLHSLFIALALFAAVHQSIAQLPIISSFSQNGVLVCTNLAPGSVASVEWASSVTGPWQTNWAGLEAVTVDTNGMIQVSVPMFYRVCGVAAVVTNSPVIGTNGMVLIPAGEFTIGNSIGDSDLTDANPTNVYVSAFYMDTNLVSYSQWRSVYNWATNHGYGFDYAGAGPATNQPVQTVDWYDVVKWSNARSLAVGLTPCYYTDTNLTQVYKTNDVDAVYVNWSASGYRLPTEAEWEKAARGGLSGQRFPWGNTISESQANYHGQAGYYSYDLGPNGNNPLFTNNGNPWTSPVGYFAANGYGLNDMAGNVFEWCWDWADVYQSSVGNPYAGGTDPRGPASSPYYFRVLRGGCWDYYADSARCAFRYGSPPPDFDTDVGFRCVRGL